MNVKSTFSLGLGLATVLASSSSFGCLSFPKKITLKDASFVSSEPMQIGSGYIPELKKKLIMITHGTDQVFFHPEKKQWCYFETSVDTPPADTKDKTSSAERKISCFKKGDKVTTVDDKNGGKKNGVLEIQNNKIYFFSVNDRGEKDITRPYMVFTDQSEDSRLKVTAEALNKSKPVGNFEMTDTTFMTRSLSISGVNENIFDLNGHSIEASGGCSQTATVSDYAPGESSSNKSGTDATATGTGATK